MRFWNLRTQQEIPDGSLPLLAPPLLVAGGVAGGGGWPTQQPRQQNHTQEDGSLGSSRVHGGQRLEKYEYI